ncbi:Rz1-like lysis system protein LysC [Escherichia coli]
MTLVLLTGCAGTQNAPRPAPSVRLIPQTLTIPVTPPPFPDTPTWGNLGIWGDRLLDALETCNADTVHTHKHGGVKGGSDSTGGPQ